MPTPSTPRFSFPRRMKISGSRQFADVYDKKVRTSVGPLLVYGIPNEIGIPRLGLAVPRRVGTAVMRNIIKRRLREAFRHAQHDWPAPQQGYDVVINVRPHDPLNVAEYQQALMQAAGNLHHTWSKKRDKKNQAREGE